MDWVKLGLKAGVEIHQQLDTNKLFCNCPSNLRIDKPDVIIKRRQNPVAGETGQIDIAAAYEATRARLFVYEGYSDSTCQVEFDSAPPRALNQEALKIALQTALLLNAKLLPITQIMRKTVIDGSNTTGFQRTLLIATDGYVAVGKSKIGIATICLEEDSARIIRQDKSSVTFRLDRLGIPLIEIATAPEITSPEQAKEVALKLGEVLRSTKIKRGIGTIRQDVNLSIRRGTRTEIKGVQKPELISKVIENEVKRQLSMIKKDQLVEPTVRKSLPRGETAFLRPLPGAARMYPETDLPLVKISDKLLKEVKAKLPKLRIDILSELRKKGVSEEYAGLLVEEGRVEDFKALEETEAESNLIAKSLILYPKEIAAHEKISLAEVERHLSVDVVHEILDAAVSKRIAASSIKQIMTEIAKGASIGIITKYQLLSSAQLAQELKAIIKAMPKAPFGAIMGAAMSKLKGRAEAKEIAALIKKLLKG